MCADNPEICVSHQIFILIMAGFQHNISILNQPLSHIFRESTFDGLILYVFHSGMKTVKHNSGQSLMYIIKYILLWITNNKIPKEQT
jgi:hypothetical protein